ncbi:MAG: SH3 domain-containing protein, partial [Bacteroidales bacterium]|nr:SH3 domain-containing protein [Bacteroidales bacterium]
MNKNSLRIAACAFAGTLALSGYHTSLQARIATPSLVPAAGIAVVLEERATIQDLTQEVIQNIAYLESASGIQPNIVIASEKVAKAETPAVDDNNDKKKKVEFRTSAGFSVLELSANGIDKDIENQEAYAEETEETTTEEEQDFSSLVIAQVNNYVNVRSIPSEEGEIVGKLYDDSVGEYIEEKDGWYKIISGKCEGYVKAEYCVTGEDAQKLAKEVGTTYAVVNTTTLKVRKEASTESAVLGLVPIEEELIVKEELDGWVKIEIEEG